MVDTYTKRPIYELIGKNNKRYFLYWIKTDNIESIEYPRSRTENKDGWIVRKSLCLFSSVSLCYFSFIAVHFIIIIELIMSLI